MFGYDKEVERFIKFWSAKKNCLILLNENAERRVMCVVHIATGEVSKDIDVGSVEETKERMMIKMRSVLKQL